MSFMKRAAQFAAGGLLKFASDDDSIGPKQPGPGDDFWYADDATAGKNASNIVVTPDLALKSSALYAVVKVLAETIATLPVRMRRTGDGGVVDAPTHPLDELIRYQPNSVQTAVEFWETLILHAVLRGTGYAEIVPGARGAVHELKSLHTDRVKPETLADGSLRFKITNPKNGSIRYLLQDEIFRVPGLSSDGVQGLRVVDIAAEAIGLGMAADQYAGRVFSNKLNIGGFLVHPGKLSPEGQKNLVHSLMMRFAGANNSHRPMVLQEGLKFERAAMDASEAQLLEARKWQVAEIARFFRVPLHMLNVYEGTTYSNVEQQAIDFVKYTLRPWCKRIELAIRRDLIVAKGVYFAEFNLEGLLRGDSAARSNYFSKALGSGGAPGWMTQNEVRAIEGLNPLPGGDKLPAQNNNKQPGAQQKDDGSIDDKAAHLVRREQAALRKAVMRFAGQPDALRTWIKAFYGGHVSTVVDILGLPHEAARAYCKFQCDETLAANDLPGLLDRRDGALAAEIAATIRKNGAE